MISKRRILDFAKSRPEPLNPLLSWYKVTFAAQWKTFAELRADFSSADQVGRRTVFNIGGNKFRLISRVNYLVRKIYVLHILTHQDYDKGAWK